MKNIIFLPLFLCAFIIVNAQIKVAVVKPYLEGNASAIHINLVKQTLVSTILKVDGYSAFSRAEIDAIFTEQSFQYGGDVNDATRKKIGDIYGADLLCISQIVGSGGELLISAMLIDVQTAEIKSSPEPVIVKAATENVKAAAKSIAEQLLGVETTVDLTDIASSTPKRQSKTIAKHSTNSQNPSGTIQLPGTDIYVAEYDELGEFNWSEAVSKCQSKGYGWRLPTAHELVRIMQNRASGKQPQGLFRNFEGGWYWSSTPDGREYSNVSSGGWVSGEKPNHKNAVRCVWCNQ